MHPKATSVVVVGGGYTERRVFLAVGDPIGVATVQLASSQDVANRFAIGGRLGAKIKSSSFTGLIEALAHEGREHGSYSRRVKNPKRQQQVLAGPSESPARRAVARREDVSLAPRR